MLESPEVDNQQLNLNSNIFESSTTNTQILTNNVEDGNSDTSALPARNSGDDIVWSADITKETAEIAR